jgi:selenocysteine-specific elongation factor
VFDFVVADAVAAGRLEDRGAGLAPAGYEVTLTESQRRTVDRFLEALRRGGASPPTEGLPEPALLAYLAGAGLIEDTGAGVVFDKPTFEMMVQRTADHIRETGSVSLAEVRDLFGTSRKYAQAFLEHLDAIRLTRRVGDARVLRPEAPR